MFGFIVILSVCLQFICAVAGETAVIVIHKQSSSSDKHPVQNFTKTSNGTEFPLLQTDDAPETVPSSSLVLETTATKNSVSSRTHTEKPTTKNVINIQTIPEATEKSSDEFSTDYAREDSTSSTPNGTVLVINVTTLDGNETTSSTTTVSSTELNLIPPANVNSSIAFVNETRKNSQIIIR